MTGPWFTASELAGQPGMPTSEFRTRAKLDKLGVPSRLRAGRVGGGGREFDAAALPAETRAALLLQVAQVGAPMLPQPGAPAAAPLPVQPVSAQSEQRRPASRREAACADARAVLVRRLEELAPLCGGITRAAQQLAQQLAQGLAAPELLAAARAANLRTRDGGHPGVRVSERTLFRWHADHSRGGWDALLPAPQAQGTALAVIAPDVAAVLQRYASTHGAARNLTHVAQAVNLELGHRYDDWRSLYDRARRALPKLDAARLIRARHTGSDRAAMLPFKRRGTEGLRPLDVVLCDGHTFKARVRHPDHGQPFAPEVTAVIDVATRYVLGWSVSLSESTIAVGDAMRHAVGQWGVPALVYTDNGQGQKAKYFDCPATGLFARLGCKHHTGIPGNPQGRGLIERVWRETTIRAARTFATFQGSDVDEGTLRKVGQELAREQRAVKRADASGEVVRLSAKCPSWRQFIEAVDRAFREYNSAHRHRGLAKHDDGPFAGLHWTPADAMTALRVEGDVPRLDAPALRNLFMPAQLCTAQRGEVRFLNQHYFAPELVQVDGQRVRVHYDIHDPAAVWVWTTDGEYVCEAKWGANRVDYFAKPVVEMARERRVLAAIKRREAQIETARAELKPTLPALPLEEPPVFIGDLAAQLGDQRDRHSVPAQLIEQQAGQAEAARPFFDSASERFEWLMQHRQQWADADAAWAATYAASDEYAALREYFESRGTAWPQGDDDTAFNAAG